MLAERIAPLSDNLVDGSRALDEHVAGPEEQVRRFTCVGMYVCYVFMNAPAITLH